MVILYHDMHPINVGVELLQAEAHWQAFSLNVCIVSLNVRKDFTGICYGVTTLY